MYNMTTSQLTRSYLLSCENDWFWGSQVLPASSEMVKVPTVPRRWWRPLLGMAADGWEISGLQIVGWLYWLRHIVGWRWLYWQMNPGIDRWLIVGWLLVIYHNQPPLTSTHHSAPFVLVVFLYIPLTFASLHPFCPWYRFDMIWFESHDQCSWIRLTPR